MNFAPELVGAYQDSEGGGERHGSSPLRNGNSSWRGSAAGWGRRRLCRALEWRLARPDVTSCFVGEPFALCANKRGIGAGEIVERQDAPDGCA